MIKFLGLFFLIISLIAIICYENQSVIMDFYSKKIVNPRSWGKIEVVQDEKITSLKDIFQSTLMWQTLEHLIGFVAGVSICVLVGWRVSCCRNIYEKSFDNSLLEWYQRQNIFEKKLGALELQIVDFERRYLFTKKEAASKCDKEPTFSKEQKQMINETTDKSNHDVVNENLASRAVEMILKQNHDESNIECILDKLNIILERLSKQSKENILPSLDVGTDLLHEQDSGIRVTGYEEYNENENLGIANETGEMEMLSKKTNEDEYQIETCHEEVTENYLYSEVSNENSPYELYQCNSNEKLANMISITGAGECEETFRGKIVPVSQIPQYQELRKNQKQKTKAPKEYEVDKTVTYIACEKTADEVITERVTPQTTPRKNTSAYAEYGVDRSTYKGGRRKIKSRES